MRYLSCFTRISFSVIAAVICSSTASAQCSTVPLVVNGVPATTFQIMPANNTLCMFGGNPNNVRGIVSCISASTTIDASNVTLYEQLLFRLVGRQSLLQGQVGQITNFIDYAFLSYVDGTSAQSVEALFLNKEKLLEYYNNGLYSLVGVGRGTYRTNISGSLKRIAFSPVVRTPTTSADVLSEAFINGSYFAFAGYDRFNPSDRFAVYRLTPSSGAYNFGDLTVCTGAGAPPTTDFFHQFSEAVTPMASLSSGRRVIHVD